MLFDTELFAKKQKGQFVTINAILIVIAIAKFPKY